ncbi:MAG: hypothetical protein ACJ8R9_10550 [Steroidobacteraceae bacterium]
MAKAIASLCVVLVGVMLLWGPAYSQDLHPDIPTHAHFSASGQGWDCDDGFRQVAGFCVLDSQDAPRRMASEVFDGQWRCRAGYQRTNGSCVLPTAPPHASLVGDGDRWECDWGFRKLGSRCEEVTPPAHGYIDASGRDWVCFPGFERSSDHCVPGQGAAPQGAAPPPAMAPAGDDKPSATPDTEAAVPH